MFNFILSVFIIIYIFTYHITILPVLGYSTTYVYPQVNFKSYEVVSEYSLNITEIVVVSRDWIITDFFNVVAFHEYSEVGTEYNILDKCKM